MVFAAVISMVYYWQVIHEPTVQIPSKIVSTNNLYKNDEYQFEVRYNKQYQLNTESDQAHYFKTGGTVLASISIPRSVYPNTNFASAAVTFAAKSKSTEADCQTYVTSANATKKMTESHTLNRTIFYTADFGGAALGTQYKTKLYRTWRNPSCFEINLTVGISNIQNYDPASGITEVAFDDIFLKLEAIANTFNFLKPAVLDDAIETGELSGRVVAPSPDAYELTQIVVYTSDRSKIVTKVNLDFSGDYYMTLPVGTYYVTYTSIYNNFQPPMKKVIIMSDEESIVDFSIN